MRKNYRYLALWLMAGLFSIAAAAQTSTVNGSVKNATSKDGVPAVSVFIKGTTTGTYTDENGNFKMTISKFPVTLVFSSVGYEDQEMTVKSATDVINVSFKPVTSLGQEVVVSATRAPQRILESPVTVERMSNTILKNLPAPSYYEAISNLKGVDMHTASLTFRTITTRGFISSGNTRMNQLIDGMDNQAPGLNFSVGSVIGLTELDVDNIELLSGASSALYGSGGMNGTLLLTSKNPFKYQGLSYNIKQGIMHIHDKDPNSPASPYYDWSIRWAKAFNDKFAFKFSGQLIKAKDWSANDYSDVQRTNVLSKVVPGNRDSDPNYDGVNMYGDETSANMIGVAQSVQYQTQAGILAATGGTLDIVALMNASLPANATQTQIATFIGSLPSTLQPSVTQMVPFYFGLRNNLIPNQNVSRTGYAENTLVDYNTLNGKFTAGLFYKITPNIEASWNTYFGTGTTVYTGADRYSLSNLKMAQHKLEFKAKNWFLRGYTTQENAGQSYNATVLGRLINEYWKPSTTWYPTYVGNYLGFLANAAALPGGASPAQAHAFARAAADQGRLLPGTAGFEAAKNAIRSLPIPRGALFLDKTDLWVAEGQLNLSDALGFSDKIETIVGGAWKENVLNSQGTLFSDTTGRIKISEFGGYVQFKKKLLKDALTLTAAGRYDKHVNFEGRFTPRFTAVIKVAKDNNIRLSYQTAYRFPTNQDQYINLNTGSSVLIGGLPEFQTFYGLGNNTWTAESVSAARAANNPGLLQTTTFKPMKPESVSSYEIGYKGLIANKLMFDIYYYYSQYQNFLARIAVVKAASNTAVLDPGQSTNYSYQQNTDTKVKSQGWGIGAEYLFFKKYSIYGNIFSDELKNVPDGFVTFFNAPKYRFNIGLRNENVYKNIGFNIVYKWQDKNYYEGTFVTGTLPSFGWTDAQVTYRLPKTKSVFRIGGTNLGNNYQRTGYGSPYVGGLYYVSYGYNIQ